MYFCSKNGKIMKPSKINDVLDNNGIPQTWHAKKKEASFTVNSYACNKYHLI